MMRKILFSLLLFAASYCNAQDFWTKLELPNNELSVNHATVDSNNRLYIGTDQGLYYSDDFGQNLIKTELDFSVNGVVVNERNELYVIGAKIYFSDDSGQNWIPLEENFLNTTPTTSYYAKGDTIIVGGWDAMYKSDNKGVTWHRCFHGGGGVYIPCFKESSNGVLFAGLISFFPIIMPNGIICSNDGGNTWVRSGLYNIRVSAIAQNSKGTIFAATMAQFSPEEGMWMSDDFGQSWIYIASTSSYFETNALTIDKNDVIYRVDHNDYGSKGVYRTIDNGTTWKHLESGMDNKAIKNFVLAPNGYMYVYGTGVLYRSTQSLYDEIYSISASANPAVSGEITGVGSFCYGQTATLTATPNAGYEFEKWTTESGEVLSTEPVYSFVVEKNTNLTANFKLSTSIGELSAVTS